MYELPFQILEKLKAKPEIFRVDYQSLSENYRAGQGTSLTISQAFAYAIGRLPATCSVINFILSKFFLNYESFTKILDVGAGCGALPIVLQNINIEYEAIEKSQKMVQVFQYLLGKNKKIHQKDFLDFQGNSQYDAVFASYAVNEFVDKETALKMLKAKLMEIKEREKLDKIEDIKGVKTNIEWGAQIRSYVFMPYTLAKDTRTGYEDGNISAVMDGEIDGFINAYLKSQAK